MSKRAFVGVNGIARKNKSGYVGVQTDIPIYEETSRTVSITADNIADYFEVTNGVYYFAGSGSTFTSNNKGMDSTTASTILKAKKDFSEFSFDYSYSSEARFDKFTLKVAGTTIESEVSGATTNKTYNGSLTKGQTIEFTYSKDHSGYNYYDQCTFSNMRIVDTIKTLVGTEKKSVARKIKKAYVGVGGVARPCWSGGELTYYGTTTGLTPATPDYPSRYNLASESVGNHVIFAGGRGCNKVDAYSDKLVKSELSTLSEPVSWFDGAPVGDYAIFAGGYSCTDSVDAYNSALVKSTPSKLSVSRYSLAGAPVKDYALFAGGLHNGVDENECVNTIDTYNSNLVRGSAFLNVARRMLTGVPIGNYALFAGGYGSSLNTENDFVEAFDNNLVKTVLSRLDSAFGEPSSGAVGSYALIAIGRKYCIYNDNLVKMTSIKKSDNKFGGKGVTLKGYVLFAGDHSMSNFSALADVDAYNSNLIKVNVDNISVARYNLAGGSVGDYALFAGGATSNNMGDAVTTVDVYTVS